MTEFPSALTRAVARQYDLFQASLESIDKERKFLNYGYTLTGAETYEERQQQLCLEVFRAADLRPDSVVVDVGFGSGEQDFLLLQTSPFRTLIGFNIAERQVRYACERALREGVAGRLVFRLGEAEALPGVEPASVDRLLAIECAFYFDRPRFYRRAAEVLKPGGLLVLADISLDARLAALARAEDLRRVGTRPGNEAAWAPFFRTRSLRSIRRETAPGVQMTVWQILKTIGRSHFSAAERREWLKMAFYSQLVALGLRAGLVHYDLVVLEARGNDPGPAG